MKRVVLIMALLSFFTAAAIAQISSMKGVVISEDDGLPIIGATVTVTGTNNITVTDMNGEFRLRDLSGHKTVTVTYIGMEPQTVAIAPEVKVTMKTVAENLDEVIVVAFGKQKREAFTGSASVVKSEDILRQQVNDPISALNGLVSGVTMKEDNSLTGNPTINIRGIGSINAGTDPLIVVDGLPYNGYWNDINPADVESISVLKDAASNALYGARGANGVILITTKKGVKGNTKTVLDIKVGANTDGMIDYDMITDPGQYYEMYYLALRNYYMREQGQSFYQAHANANANLCGSASNGGLGYQVYAVPEGQYMIGENGRLNPNATLGNRIYNNGNVYTLLPDDWRDEGLRTGLRQEYNLNISGGGEKYSIMASMGYLNNEGICYGSDLERYTARLKTDFQAYPWLNLKVNAGYTHKKTHSNAAAFAAAHDMAPIYPVYIRDGNGNIMTDSHGKMYDYGDGKVIGIVRENYKTDNPLQSDLLDLDKNTTNAFNIQGVANIDFLKDFRFTVSGSVYITEYRYSNTVNPYYGYNTNGYVYTSHRRYTDQNFQQLLTWNRSFGRHNADVLLGHEYTRNDYTHLSGEKNLTADYDSNKELAGALLTLDTDGYKNMYNVEGYFVRAQYDYDNKYFASASFRRDGSSRFHPDHRWGNFWSLGGAWILSKEGWFPKTRYVNMLKAKLSYGEQGNDNIGDFLYTDRYTIANSNGEVSYVFYSKGNPDITWETTGSLNAGIEFELFGSRLSGSFEYYNRKTSDMLMWFSVPYSLGYEGYYDNIGDIKNEGVELNLSGDIFATRDFQWTVNANLTWQRNRVTYLPDEKKTKVVDGYSGYENGSFFCGEGLPLYTWYTKKYAGVDESGQSMWYDADGNPTTRYDDAVYRTCGSALPDVYGGFGTSLRFKGFDLSAQFNYSIGGDKMDESYMTLMGSPYSSYTGYNIHKDVLGAWSETNRSSDIPRWQYGDIYANSESDRWLTDASYLTFKNITVGYTIPDRITRKFFVSNLRVYFSCENVYYWTARKGFDPRSTMDYTDDSLYSPMRTFTGGVNIQF